MFRLTFCVLISISLCGCQSSAAPWNPFMAYAPARIPPPPTGAAGRTDPYYSPSAGPAARATSGQPTAGNPALATMPAAGSSLAQHASTASSELDRQASPPSFAATAGPSRYDRAVQPASALVDESSSSGQSSVSGESETIEPSRNLPWKSPLQSASRPAVGPPRPQFP